MTKNNPLISVLICNYNYGKYIRETLDSALNQTYKNLEIIVIDDGSQDDSVSIIKEYINTNPDASINLNAKQQNQGLCYARNDAIDLANGEYILFLDSDDTIPSNYISDLFETAIQNKADVVYSDMKSFGDEVGETNFPEHDLNTLLLRNYINISSLMRKSAIKEHRFDVSLNHKTLEDYDFWLGLSLMGLKFVKAKNSYINYRVQNQSRNENASSLETRILNFISVWKYSIDKYRQKYPDKIQDDIEFEEFKYQIRQIGKELINLNDVVHKELIPELEKREKHIQHLEQSIWEIDEKYSESQRKYKVMLESKDYQIGQWVMKPLRGIKKRLKL